MSGEWMQVPEDVYVSVVENLKIDLQNARNERDRAWEQRNEARAEVERLQKCHTDAVEVGKDLHNQWFSGLFRSYVWRRAAKNYRRERDEAVAYSEEQHQESLRLLERLSVAHRERDEARAEVERLKRGIEAYRADHHAAVDRCGCEVCAWEDEDAERRESGDESRA